MEAQSAIVQFLSGDGRDAAGRSFEEVLAMDDVGLEGRHDFIQWLFPLDEPSQAVPSSPVLTGSDILVLRNFATVQLRLRDATERMLRFYRATAQWKQPFDHNHLRITRIIKSLRLLAGDGPADAFKAAILSEAEDSQVSPTSRRYWSEA
ncbi:hypothetical protein G3545_27195 [Starkeya sp. ORNL1]|uniref:opioid growth factor receptor-related protein n=1 Tax=Starkeya sp. ORNL1 TaxID=2709380 RepID=UPI0014641D4D|nr:opioid growth factor receptor-related protein [Starkeya sp. ORNL1]QJP17009.1 hypothetical protein G3545_27195 [Starkeya sp. ORNL1]